MKDLEKALTHYRKTTQLLTLKNMLPVEELKFRLFCIKNNYDAGGYSEINSLENFLHNLVENRTNIKTMYVMTSLEQISLSELVEEAEINRLICKSYNMLIKKILKYETLKNNS